VVSLRSEVASYVDSAHAAQRFGCVFAWVRARVGVVLSFDVPFSRFQHGAMARNVFSCGVVHFSPKDED